MQQQTERYDDFYDDWQDVRQLARFDVRYRCRRMHEVLRALDVPTRGIDVLDVGFGWGQMLASFPMSCRIVGADISSSAVECARSSPRFRAFAAASFAVVGEDRPDTLPAGPFDVIVSSHTLEHCYDDRKYLETFLSRLRPGGHAVIFVPIEEPDYIKYHVRSYSVQSIVERVKRSGFEVRHYEGSMYVNGHVWKLITIPSRRQWPVVRHVIDAYRLVTLSSLSYPMLRRADELLYRLGFGARQALVVASRPLES